MKDNYSAMKNESKWKQFKKAIIRHRYAYILLLPAMLLILLFGYVPIFGVVIAFKDYNIFDGLWGSPWVGLDNFVIIFKQRAVLKSIGNTLIYSLVMIFGSLPFPIFLALLLNEIKWPKFKKVVQTVSYLPHFLSMVAVVTMVYAFLATEGPFTSLLSAILGEGYIPKNYLMDSKYFLLIAFLTNLWKSLGWSTVIYLAAIAGVDAELYDAATVDGAGKLRQAWHITLPSIRPTIVILLVMNMGSLFSANFELVYNLQNVFTIDDTEVINTLIYRTGIQSGNYSTATAFGLMQGLITVILILLSNAFSKRVADISIW